MNQNVAESGIITIRAMSDTAWNALSSLEKINSPHRLEVYSLYSKASNLLIDYLLDRSSELKLQLSEKSISKACFVAHMDLLAYSYERLVTIQQDLSSMTKDSGSVREGLFRIEERIKEFDLDALMSLVAKEDVGPDDYKMIMNATVALDSASFDVERLVSALKRRKRSRLRWLILQTAIAMFAAVGSLLVLVLVRL